MKRVSQTERKKERDKKEKDGKAERRKGRKMER